MSHGDEWRMVSRWCLMPDGDERRFRGAWVSATLVMVHHGNSGLREDSATPKMFWKMFNFMQTAYVTDLQL